MRRDNGQSYNDYLKELAPAAGIENPTREQLARLDRKRKKKGSNQVWMSPSDPDTRITKMKDGRTHLAHKAEHAVDLTSGAILALTLQGRKNILKRLLVHGAAFNLSLILRKITGVGKPRRLQGLCLQLFTLLGRALACQGGIQGCRTQPETTLWRKVGDFVTVILPVRRCAAA